MLQQIVNFIASLQNQGTMLLVVGSVTLLALAMAVSGFRSPLLRMLFYFGLAGIMFSFSAQLQDINGEFFLNIGVELLGAVLTSILLGGWVTSQSWLFPIIFIITILSTLPLTSVDPTLQPLWLNLSAQLVGSFLIVILVRNREWLWNTRNRRQRQTLTKQRDSIRLDQQRQLEQWKQNELEIVRREIEVEMRTWEVVKQQWDVALKVGGTSKEEVKTKVQHIRKSLNNVTVLKVETDEEAQLVQCYLVASVRTNQLG